MGFMLVMPCNTLLRMINPLWLAHRGSWHNEFKENSIDAFNHTVQRLGFCLDGFECDLRQYSHKKSDSWVIHHDPFPTKNKQPWRQFKTRKDHLFLPDFCSWISEQSKPFTLNIEIKSGSPNGVSFLVDALLNANQRSIISYVFSTFDKRIFSQLTQFNAPLQLAYLIRLIDDLHFLDQTTPSKEPLAFIGVAAEHLTPEIKKEALQRDIGLGIYFLSLNSFYNNLDKIRCTPNVVVIFTED